MGIDPLRNTLLDTTASDDCVPAARSSLTQGNETSRHFLTKTLIEVD